MRKLQITLTEEQYQNILAKPSYGKRNNFEEETFGGYELCPHVGSPDFFPATLKMNMMNTINLGEVEWKSLKFKL